MELSTYERLREQERHSSHLNSVAKGLRGNLQDLKITFEIRCLEPRVLDNVNTPNDMEMIYHVSEEISESLRTKLNYGRECLLGKNKEEIIDKIHFWTKKRMAIETKRDEIRRYYNVMEPNYNILNRSQNISEDQFRQMVRDYISSVLELVSGFDSDIRLGARMRECERKFKDTESSIL
jgi:hypothetical protein